MNRAGGHKEEEEGYAGYALDDGEEGRRGRRSLFLIDGHRIISGWPGRSRSTMEEERKDGRQGGKGEELKSWRCAATARTAEFRGIPGRRMDTRRARSPRRGPRRPGALLAASSPRIRGLSHAAQRALLSRAPALHTHTQTHPFCLSLSFFLTHSLSSSFSLLRRSRRRCSARRPQHGRAITCRYWSLIGTPDPSVDMPIIGLPRRQPTPVRP